MPAPLLNPDILRTIFNFHIVNWTNPPWYAQHDLDIWHGQRAVASYALVCRDWNRASRPVLLRKPVLRLTYRNCVSFLCAIMRQRPSIVSFLGLFALDASVNFLTIRNLLNKVCGFAAPEHSLFFDNVPRAFFVYFDNWIIAPTTISLGIRSVDVVAGPAEQEPARLSLPELPSIRALFCCNVDLSDLFLSPTDTVQHISTLSLQYCQLSAEAIASLSRFVGLRNLFLGNMTFTPHLLSSFPLGFCDHLDWFGIFGLAISNNATNGRRAWSKGISKMPVPFLEKVTEDLAANDSARPPTSPLSFNLSRASQIWSYHHLSNRDRIYPPIIALAVKISIDLVWAFQQQMGFCPPVWAPWANPSTPQFDMIFGLGSWRLATTGDVKATQDYLSAVAGFPVHLLIDETIGKSFEETHGWGELYVACNARQAGLATLIQEKDGRPPNEYGMGRVLSLVGPALSEPKAMVFGTIWDG